MPIKFVTTEHFQGVLGTVCAEENSPGVDKLRAGNPTGSSMPVGKGDVDVLLRFHRAWRPCAGKQLLQSLLANVEKGRTRKGKMYALEKY